MNEGLHTLADRLAVQDVLSAYARAIDGKDWVALEAVFTADMEADFRAFAGRETVKGRDRWIAAIRLTIAGLDATQHLLGNHRVSLDGDRATMNAYVQAVHRLKTDRGDGEYTIGGHYDVELRREAGGWRIAFYRLNVLWDRGNRDIMRQAARRAGGG